VILATTLLTLLCTATPVEGRKRGVHALLLFSTAGCLHGEGDGFMTVFLGLETMIPSTALVGFHRNRMTSPGALKYFLLGAFASGFSLYGSPDYSVTGTTKIRRCRDDHDLPLGNRCSWRAWAVLSVRLSRCRSSPSTCGPPMRTRGATVVTAFMAAGEGGRLRALMRVTLLTFPALAGMTNICGSWRSVTCGGKLRRAPKREADARVLSIASGVHPVDGRGDIRGGQALFYLLVYAFMNLAPFGWDVCYKDDGYDIGTQGSASLPVLGGLAHALYVSLAGIRTRRSS